MVNRSLCAIPVFLVLFVRSGAAQNFLAADFNSDGNVDFHDFVIMGKGFASQPENPTRADGDTNGDRRLDIVDIFAFKSFYGNSTAPSAAYPEDRDVALIADDRGRLFLYTRNNISPNERVPMFGYSIQSGSDGLTRLIGASSLFDFNLANEPSEVTRGHIGPGRAGLKLGLCCSAHQLDTKYDTGAGIDDLTFRYGTPDGSFEGPVLPGIPGDADLDGQVQFTDFLLLSSSFGMPGEWGDGDFDDSGDVAFGDFLILSQHFNQSMTPGLRPVTVPEPNGYLLLVAAMAPFVRRRLLDCAKGHPMTTSRSCAQAYPKNSSEEHLIVEKPHLTTVRGTKKPLHGHEMQEE